MKLTKYTHSCVRLENEGKVLVLDPGGFSEVETALDGADYIFVTHVHPDHFDVERVAAFIEKNKQVPVYAPQAVLDALVEKVEDAQVYLADAKETILLEGFELKTFGGQHALIHPLIKTIDNVGVLVNDNVFHPGDSFTVPHGIQSKTLLAPIHAPWNKMSEVIDFVISVGASTVYPIHDSLLADSGRNLIETQVTNLTADYGVSYKHLDTGDTVEL
ncbi:MULTISPECIES: MBL fold metallo-hydrolase [unclassified Rothia (in: high G+C Gram-positive bacteria)]|uniref:MBL fold metallo-hydrolase n=1 Tax=unclassified Rothia (in: high G+C Gram-positive bacteria) TaxID=2689056 RepID=UPI00195A78CD|nr:MULTISPECIES: MBL fold metallo-hydrolase [unclassified Rothia (in: high G+C Gram-positive bacteria)]MBM7051044.1 MBL fold metallo-hydrolase [Rothia sp. ZJ1223]QRZ62251.1 MBL fold metallo-hydrolase [Rothia sp. ZJ932]